MTCSKTNFAFLLFQVNTDVSAERVSSILKAEGLCNEKHSCASSQDNSYCPKKVHILNPTDHLHTTTPPTSVSQLNPSTLNTEVPCSSGTQVSTLSTTTLHETPEDHNHDFVTAKQTICTVLQTMQQMTSKYCKCTLEKANSLQYQYACELKKKLQILYCNAHRMICY